MWRSRLLIFWIASYVAMTSDKFSKISFYRIFFFFGEFDIFGSCIVSGEDGFQIGIPGKDWFIVSKCEDSSCCIFSDSREFFEDFFIFWKYTIVFFADYFCSFQEIASSRIVSESLIIWEKFFITCHCKTMYRWIFSENFFIKGNYSVGLSLLQEYLRKPDTISDSIIGFILSPWKIMFSIIYIPIEKYLPRKRFHL